MDIHRPVSVRPVRAVAAALLLAAVPTVPVFAAAHEEPAYRDDRSTPTAVIESLYNAINRHEFARAYSYWGDGASGQSFEQFMSGYKGTVRIRLYTGAVTSEGAAGSTYYSVPVSLRSVNADGTTVVFAGCYTVRLADPKIQAEPPFVPMHIESGKLMRARGRTSQAVPESCGG